MSYQIFNPNEYPYRAVCSIHVKWGDGSLSRGTGCLVGINDILTATHVIYNPDRGGWAKEISMNFGAYTGQYNSEAFKTLDSFKWTISAWPDQVFNDKNNASIASEELPFDMAIIGIDVDIGNECGWFGLDSGYDYQTYAYSVGYPGIIGFSTPSNGLIEHYIKVNSIYGSYYTYDGLDTLGPGSSGGPLFVYENNQLPYVIGVKSSGTDGINNNWSDIGFLYDQIADEIDKNNNLLKNKETISIERLQQFFVAYYGRPGNKEGMDYWISQVFESESTLVWNFGNSVQPEFLKLYGSATNPLDFIGAVFNNLFNRDAEESGINYWIGEYYKYINQGQDADSVRAKLVIWIMDGAVDTNAGRDKTTLLNKTALAINYTNAINTETEIYSYERNLDAGRAFLKSVNSTTDPNTVNIDAAIADMVASANSMGFTNAQLQSFHITSSNEAITEDICYPESSFNVTLLGFPAQGTDFYCIA